MRVSEGQRWGILRCHDDGTEDRLRLLRRNTDKVDSFCEHAVLEKYVCTYGHFSTDAKLLGPSNLP